MGLYAHSGGGVRGGRHKLLRDCSEEQTEESEREREKEKKPSLARLGELLSPLSESISVKTRVAA